jgi:hypothetical protein
MVVEPLRFELVIWVLEIITFPDIFFRILIFCRRHHAAMVDLHLEFELIDLGSHLETLSLPVRGYYVHISGLGVLSDVPGCATRGHNVGDVRHHLINVHPAAYNGDFLSHALDLLV